MPLKKSIRREVMIHHGEDPKLDQDLVPRKLIIKLLDAGLLVSAHIFSQIGLHGRFYAITHVGVPARYFRGFLRENPDIHFEDEERVNGFLYGNDSAIIGIHEEFWYDVKESLYPRLQDPIYTPRPGTPNIIFSVDIDDPRRRARSAPATYAHLYKLIEFLKSNLK